MSSLSKILLEYLTDKQRKSYSLFDISPKMREKTDHVFGAGNDRLVEPLKKHQLDKSEVHKAIESHLNREISHEEYRSGTVKDKYNRDVKLGKLIKDDSLRDQYASDNSRQGSKALKEPYMSIVRGYEVAGQTNSQPNELHPNGHSWGEISCKNNEDGLHKDYLHKEIKAGTVVVFGHDHDGKEIYRATLQPHHNFEDNNQTIYSINSEYGIKHPDFRNHAQNVAERLSSKVPKSFTTFDIDPYVYNDKRKYETLHPSINSEDISQKLKEHIDEIKSNKSILQNVKRVRLLISHADEKINEDHLRQIYKSNDEDLMYSSVVHKRAPVDILHDAIDMHAGTENHHIAMEAINHNNMKGEDVKRYLNHPSKKIRQQAENIYSLTGQDKDNSLKLNWDPIKEQKKLSFRKFIG
jgi:hypothetical protein